jgi:hypothetical protein
VSGIVLTGKPELELEPDYWLPLGGDEACRSQAAMFSKHFAQ